MKPSDYLDEVLQSLDLSTDYQAAKALSITRAAVSLYRHNRRTFDNLTAFKVAERLQIPPMRVIADMEILRAKTDEQHGFWVSTAQQLAPGKTGNFPNEISRLTI